jgi:hypothetical protein
MPRRSVELRGAWHFAQFPFISNDFPPAWWQVLHPALDVTGMLADCGQSLSWHSAQLPFSRFTWAA